MLTALLFDLDGTMADTDPLHYQTWQEVLRGYGLEFDSSFYKAHFSGRLNEEIIRNLLPQLSVKEGQQLSQYKEAEFRNRALTLKPLPGLSDLLTWMDEQELKRAVVTNAPRENAQFMLRVLKLEDIFPIVILGEELAVGKPDPLPYQVAIDRLEVTPEQAVVFEDSPSGIRSAVGAGIPTIAIASTHDPKELSALGATLVVPDFADSHLQTWLQLRLSDVELDEVCTR